MRGPLPLSPHLLFLPSVSSFPSPTSICSLSLSLPCLTISMLSLPLLHIISSLFDKTKSEHQARPISMVVVSSSSSSLFFFFFFFNLMVDMDRQIGGGWVWIGKLPSTMQRCPPHNLRSLSTNTTTQYPTHHIHSNPWPDHHATLCRHLCWWWLVGIVAAMVVGGRCCVSGGCAIVVVNSDDRDEIIYYFNV